MRLRIRIVTADLDPATQINADPDRRSNPKHWIFGLLHVFFP